MFITMQLPSTYKIRMGYQVADAFVTAGLSSIESEIPGRGSSPISVKQDTQREPEKITCATG